MTLNHSLISIEEKKNKTATTKLSSVPSGSVATASLSHVVGQQDSIALFRVSGSH